MFNKIITKLINFLRLRHKNNVEKDSKIVNFIIPTKDMTNKRKRQTKKQKKEEYEQLQRIYEACEPIILFPQDNIASYTENTQDTNSQSTEYFSSSGGDFGGGGASSDYSSSNSDNNSSSND